MENINDAENQKANKTGRNTLTSVLIVLLLTVGTKILGFVREMATTRILGAGIEIDAYAMSQKITVTIFMAIGAAITVSIVPIINKYYANNEADKANKALNKIISFFAVVTMGISIIAIILADKYTTFIAGGYEAEKLRLTIDFVRILFPSIIFIFLAYVIRAVLQARQRFVGYSIMSIPFNIIIIIYLVFFLDIFGIYGLPVAVLLAWLCQLLVQLPFLGKDKVKFKFELKLKDEDMKMFFILFIPVAISTLIYSINTLVDSSFASYLGGDGNVGALNSSYQAYAAIAQTLIYSISAVLFPKLVDNFVVKKFEEFREDAKNIIYNILYIMIPAQTGLMLMSGTLIELAFKSEKFSGNALIAAQSAFFFFSTGLIGFAIQEIMSKMFFAAKNTIIPTTIAIVSVGVNYILNSILIKQMGVGGLALATSLSITFNAVLLYVIFQIKYGRFKNMELMYNTSKIILASIGMYFSVNYLLNNLHKVIAISNNFVYNLISVSVAGILGVCVYAVLTYILRVKQTQEIVSKKLFKK